MINSYPFYPQNYYPPPPFYPQNMNNKTIRNNNNINKSASTNNITNSMKSNKLNNIKNNNMNKQAFENPKRTQSHLHKPSHNSNQSKAKKEIEHSIDSKYDETIMFELFGIKLHQDDILLICLIFFLYNEGIKDEFLFVALILLLLS